MRLDLHPAEPSEVAFAAFYADCRHEVLPVTAGHRLTLDRIDTALAAEALSPFLSLPAVYTMDDILLPAALGLREQSAGNEPASYATLCRAVSAHLDRRVAEPLKPPADWTREGKINADAPTAPP